MFIPPMLATLTDRREFPGPRGKWVFERKLDGFRALAFRKGKTVQLLSRNEKDFGVTYPELVEALRAQPLKDFIVDGEIVAFAGRRVSFEQLQQRLKAVSLAQARSSGIRIAYHVFDLLWVNGYDVRELPLRHRQRLLKQAIVFDQMIRSTPHQAGAGPKAWEQACRNGWEGLIAKDADSPYVSGRTRYWYKVKCSNRQEFVIGGYTDPHGSRIVLGALLMGYYEDGVLKYAGKVGAGYSQQTLRMLGERLGPLATSQPPFARDPDLPRRNVHWVKPKLVAEVQFSQWTRDGKLRHPQFLGLRPDKSPAQVSRERPTS